jgi:hypothetical protein
MGEPNCFHIVLRKIAGDSGQSHSSVKFSCPDGRVEPTKFSTGSNGSKGSTICCDAACDEPPPLFGALFWNEIGLECAASIAALEGGAPCGQMRPPNQQRMTVFYLRR